MLFRPEPGSKIRAKLGTVTGLPLPWLVLLISEANTGQKRGPWKISGLGMFGYLQGRVSFCFRGLMR